MSTTIALLPGSFKPYHAGHDGLVRLAASECDEVHLFISTSDRSRKGEMTIYGTDMQRIWLDFIEPTLPENVVVEYGGAPVQKVYAELEEAEAAASEDTYVIYSDEEDILKYTDAALTKVAPTLFENGQIERRPVSRTETVPVSGTKMREYLATGDSKNFAKFLSPSIRQYSQQIIDILTRKQIGESLLKRYIKEFIQL